MCAATLAAAPVATMASRRRTRNMNTLRGLSATDAASSAAAAHAVSAHLLSSGSGGGQEDHGAQVVLVTGPGRSGKTTACLAALRQSGLRIRSVDLLEPQSLVTSSGLDAAEQARCDRRSSSSSSSSTAHLSENLGKYCTLSKAVVFIDDIDTSLSILGQPGQAALLQLLQRTVRADQHVVLTSTDPEPLSGSGRTIRMLAQLVTAHVRIHATTTTTDNKRTPAPAHKRPGNVEAALLFDAAAESTECPFLQSMALDFRSITTSGTTNRGTEYDDAA
jgi:hypothetical protein